MSSNQINQKNNNQILSKYHLNKYRIITDRNVKGHLPIFRLICINKDNFFVVFWFAWKSNPNLIIQVQFEKIFDNFYICYKFSYV